ncbi:hypothetical protein DNTS_005525 [Danionella cerebrum]|uniref:CXXC-type domain-containing protein n=1 Tax=Danionella cerebrum TaxID=2873325 RepID=A0A553NJS0_9TELE|nr:hypothetical protein DNTS_005525 [Danionella translucida]
MSGRASAGARRRRTRCRRCQACVRSECGECHFCKDMKKFGGPGRMKQSCLLRQCTAPVLPHTAVCLACGEAGKEDTVESEEEKFSLSLMECTICNEIIHPSCLKMSRSEGIINEEIPNCWECPKCHREGKTSKRRLDNGEVSRWKLTDDPPPSKKKSLDDALRTDSTKRKKEKEKMEVKKEEREKEKDPPQESGAKKKIKGAREKHLKKRVKPSSESPEPNGPTQSQDPSSSSSSAGLDQRWHQREKLERFKRMCQLLERARASSSSSSSSSGSESGSDSDPPSHPSSPSHRDQDQNREKDQNRDQEHERSRRLAELGFSASEDSEPDPEEERRSGRVRRTGPDKDPEQDEAEEEDHGVAARSLGLTAVPEGLNLPRRSQNGPEARNGRPRAASEKEIGANFGSNHRHRPARNRNRTGAAVSGARQSQSSTGSSSTNGTSGPLNTNLGPTRPKRSPPPAHVPPRPPQMERHLVRPPPPCPEPHRLPLNGGGQHSLTREHWIRIFQNLSQSQLSVCMSVCRTWSRWCCDQRLWRRIDLSRQRSITPPMLSSIIRRQPVSLDLGHTHISRKQLMWLISRLQGLLELRLSGCPWTSVSALCQSVCPCLRSLDLSHVEELKDSHLRELLAPPTNDTRSAPGRFQNVRELCLSGLQVTDAVSRLIVRYLPHLSKLDLSQCAHITDQSVHTLTHSPLRESLTHLSLAGCVRVTDQCVPLLRRCVSLRTLDLRFCGLVSSEAGQVHTLGPGPERRTLKNS